MRVLVQQEQKFLVINERALWRYDNAFIFTNQSEADFGITLVLLKLQQKYSQYSYIKLYSF